MNKILLLPLLGAMVLALTACQLAQEEAAVEEDTLIGGFVTARTEREDLQMELPEEADGNSRLYAQGDSFPGMEGVCFTYEITYDSEANAYTTRSGPNGGLWEGGVTVGSVNYDTEREQRTAGMAGKVYFEERQEVTVFTLYPVFQTSSGEIYLFLGGRINVSGEGEGVVSSTSYTHKSEVEVNGRRLACETALKVEIDTKPTAQTVTLVQLDEAHQVLSQEDFLPGQCPDQLAPQPETAYLLVEYRDSQGEVTERELVQRGEEYLYTAWQMDSGFFAAQPTELIWKE